jgi:group I intron endonuclease
MSDDQDEKTRLNVNFRYGNALPRGQNNIGVYTIRHSETEKEYHGSSKNIRRRLSEHRTDLNCHIHGNSKLQELAAENANFEVSFTPTETVEDARKIEQERIDNTPSDRLLNLCLDTENFTVGLWKNPEIRKKFIEAKIGNTNNANRVWTQDQREEAARRMTGNKNLKGHVFTTESLLKMSESGRNKPARGPEVIAQQAEGRTRHRVVIGDMVFQNSQKAADHLGVSFGCVKKRCASDNFPEYKLVPKEELSDF